MRTAPVALAHLNDPAALVEAAVRVATLSHYDPVGGDACALWCLAIRHAALEGSLAVVSRAGGLDAGRAAGLLAGEGQRGGG